MHYYFNNDTPNHHYLKGGTTQAHQQIGATTIEYEQVAACGGGSWIARIRESPRAPGNRNNQVAAACLTQGKCTSHRQE
jgi:NAD(P)H-flavin reductase